VSVVLQCGANAWLKGLASRDQRLATVLEIPDYASLVFFWDTVYYISFVYILMWLTVVISWKSTLARTLYV